MTFKDAEAEIVELTKPISQLTVFHYTKKHWPDGKIEVECRINVVCNDRCCLTFDAQTWQGVIDKLKIHLQPKGEPSPEEAPDETGG